VGPALILCQVFDKVGERTLYWYSCWRGPASPGVLMTSWERDRLGYLQPFRPHDARAIPCPIRATDGQAPVHVNVSGLGPHTYLRIDVLEEGFRPLPGLSGEDGAVVRENGLAVRVEWPSAPALPASGRVRLDIHFEGVRPEDARLHTLYLGELT
jgi:hypothetical protein